MGNHQSSLEKEAQSIVARVWDDDPTTKEASIDFARRCLEDIGKLDAQRRSGAQGPPPPPPRVDAIERRMLETIAVLDTYLERMVKKLYLQCDRRTGKFDHPLLLRFWRYDPAKGKYAQTRSGRGLSICTGQPRAMHVLRSEPLIQELEMPLPTRQNTSRNNGQPSRRSSTAAASHGGGAVAGAQAPATPHSQQQQPVATIMPDNPFQPFSVPGPPGAGAGDGDHIQDGAQAAPVVLFHPNEASQSHCRRVCLVFRGDVMHPLARLRDFPLSGGVLDLVLLKENDSFHADLIDDAQVRMLSAHTIIGRNSKYINLLYRLATHDVLATLRQYGLHKESQKSGNELETCLNYPSDAAHDESESVAGRFMRRLSAHLNVDISSSLLPQRASSTKTSIANHAWHILTSLREPRLNARLLVDLFDQASLEHRVLSHRASRRGPPPGVAINGGLPCDLARLIGSFVPNHVQSTVMNV